MLIPAWAMLAAWWGSRTGDLRPVDLRVYLAGFESVARRCRAQKGRPVRHTAAELRRITDLASERAVRASLRRLAATGLMTWSAAGPHYAEQLDHVTLSRPGPMLDALDLVAMHDRRVPMPRRLLVELCRSNSPGLVATAMGHLLRSMFNGRRACRAGGLCKASWIAEVFGLSIRSVRRSTAMLVRSGALTRERVAQRVMNRHGGVSTWNLHWNPDTQGRLVRHPHRVRVPAIVPDLRVSLPPVGDDTGVSPPRRTDNSLSGSEHQQRRSVSTPASSAHAPTRDGVRSSRGRGAMIPAIVSGRTHLRGLGHVRPGDLRSRDGLRRLFVRATACGLVRASEAGALNFAAAAAHALRVGTSNPCGLFATLLRRGLWRYLSAEDEDQARDLSRVLCAAVLTPRPQHAPVHPLSMLTPEPHGRVPSVRRLVLASLASVAEVHAGRENLSRHTSSRCVPAGSAVVVGARQAGAPDDERRDGWPATCPHPVPAG